MSILTIEKMTHMYGDQTNFKSISFRLLRGEHAGIVGENGAGKTTLLKLIAGELLPDEGIIEKHPHMKMGYLQQHIDLNPGVTIKGFLQEAYAHLFAAEREIHHITDTMSSSAGELEGLLSRYGELQNALDQSDFYQVDAKMEEIAAGLGLKELGMERDCATLSGGQRTKLLLGKLLLEKPDILLLDEPTNFLDDVHIQWLINYLKQYEQAYLVISHDERFLNEVTNIIFHISQKSIKRYPGNYAFFQKSYELSKVQLHQAYEKQQKEIEKLEEFIDKNRNRKARQAKSREKTLIKTVRMEKPSSQVRPKFTFLVKEDPVSKVLQAEALEVGYGDSLFSKSIHFQVRRGDKIALVGYNGIGKSTLLKTLLGFVPAISGKVLVGERVKAAYFAQEELESDQTPLAQVWSIRPDLTQRDIRRSLARSGLTEEHINKPLRLLSGGEQAKVRLCELCLTDSNLLILDEPTNHLDVLAKEALKEALQAYEGTLILVSHEPDFYQDWITTTWKLEDLN
ncbi:ABC-F family ATP-binding cassette domain-containing protein [Cytobacillus purgationiresistens]|uniref:ATPase subunit of ABC transporter with duplicated ATPase domains n=1 Tax=Cytobacillus purgationiresistens TaxID=863449 RepID=A0ABU0AI53_9BACI|nr:ABC-F family ATP-binding cassette domain-containing protein [Cytobacillus purgationiresistens]MDQ0270574.1 ATPase subunit of ABC transporter with duplicated ATPase domains [Cytobacillus purgationiresistens]